MTRLARAIGVWACLLGAATCRSETTPAPPSTALSGTLQVFSAKADDYAYFLDLSLTAVGSAGATVSSADVTFTTSPSKFTTKIDLPAAQHVAAGATLAEPRLVISNQGGHPYATAASVTVSYVDDLGRTGSLVVTAAVPTCQAFFFQASCAKTNLQVGESSTCSGFVEFGCQPMFEPVDASQIQWHSDAPSIAIMSSDFHLVGVSNGTTRLTGSYSGVSTAIPVCVGPQCAPPVR